VIHEDRQRAQSFGENAAQYDRARPSYPAAMVDDLMADGPRRVLDVGCGTGKAGRLLAERGCEVVGVEPDPRMAEVARSHGLRVEVGKFEEWDSRQRAFDLLVSGQAWHWVEPDAGLAKAAEVIRPGGRFAAFWNLGEHEPPTLEAFTAVYERLGVELRHSVALGTYKRDGGASFVAELEAAGGFESIDVRKYYWDQRYSRVEWLDQLPTHSDHRILAPDKLRAVLAEIGDVIDGLGGSVLIHYDTMLVTALRIAG
jgi:SAM-dependent methyltransferase